MNILEQIKQRFIQPSTPHPNPETNALRNALDVGQRAKRAEDYPRALEALQAAMNMAHTAHDSTAIAVIALNQAEVYIRQRKWAEADELLQRTYQNAKETNELVQQAYLLSTMGTLAQAQGDWASAAQHYEQALQVAREGNAVGAEGRALGFLADTYLHDSNASYASHLFREALPKLNLTGDVELSSYFVGRLGEALIASGNEIEGSQMLERAHRLARQMNYRIYERHWSSVLADRAITEGRYSDAYAHYVHVLTLSKDTPPSAETVNALCQLSKICLHMQENAEALDFAQQAVAMSTDLDEPALLARAKGVLGMALVSNGQPAEAIPYLEAVTNAQATSDSEWKDISFMRNLAAAYADTGDAETAIQTYQRVAERAEATDDRLELAQTRRDLGLLYARLHRLPDAIREWTAAVAIYEAERQPAQVARLLCDMAAARKHLGQGQRAMRDYEQALMSLNMIDDDWETRGLVLSNAANAYVDQGDIESAEAFFNESIAIARRLNNEAAEATRRGNYGWFLLSAGKVQQAISALEYALRLSKSLKLDLQSAIQTDNLGLAYDALGNYDKALEYHQEALRLIQPLGNLHWECSIKINMGNTLLKLARADEATPLLTEALERGRKDEDTELVVRSLTGLARVSLHGQQPESATAMLDEATTLARKADMRRLLAEALTVYSEQQAVLGQPERSLSLWEEARKLLKMLHSPQAALQPAWLNARTPDPTV